MVDNVEPHEDKAAERARQVRERREMEQRRKLAELQAQAQAAQALCEQREEERRRRQLILRAKEEERRQMVEMRKRAMWEASLSRREAILRRDRERAERLERTRNNRSHTRSAFAFGSSTPRLLDLVGCNWAGRRSASITNVMAASVSDASSANHSLFGNDNEQDENEKGVQIAISSVARRRTDLFPTVPASRVPGRAYSMTRLDKIPAQRSLHSASPSMHHLNRTQWRSGETSPSSRPGSALSSGTVPRRPNPPRRPRPVSIAGTGVNTPKGMVDGNGQSAVGTPIVSRDGTLASPGDMVQRRPATARKPRPLSAHGGKSNEVLAPGEGKPPLQRKPKPSKQTIEQTTPGRNQVNPVEVTQKLEKLQRRNGPDEKSVASPNVDKSSQMKEQKRKMETAPELVVELKPNDVPKMPEKKDDGKTGEKREDTKSAEKKEDGKSPEKKEDGKSADKKEDGKSSEKKENGKSPEKKDDGRERSPEKKEETDVMTSSMSARRITTEEEAKAALAERRRKAREELEKLAELDRQRLKREEEEEALRIQQEEARLRKEEEEAMLLARLQRQEEEEKLRKAIEAQEKAEREEQERLVREEKERQARLREEEEKRKAAEEAERLRREESEREEKERLARKQRVEAIMARTRLKKMEEKKQQELNAMEGAQTPNKTAEATEVKHQPNPVEPAAAQTDNGNVATGDLLNFDTSQAEKTATDLKNATAALTNDSSAAVVATPNNGNDTDLLGLSEQNSTEDKAHEQTTPSKQQSGISPNANSAQSPNNGNVPHVLDSNVGHISADFIQSERLSSEHSQKVAENASKLIEDDFTAHNGHGATHDNTLLTLQN